MRAQLYNNPYFATGLSDMLGGFLGGGDPYKIATAELAAAKAGNENDTRLYRQQMGEAGNGGDLAQMLVSALQAGSDFSREAPEITAALAGLPGSGIEGRDFAKVLVGTGLEDMPGDTLSDMLAGYMIQPSGGGGGGGGGRAGGGAPAATAAAARALSRGGTSALLSDLGEKGLTPDEAYGVVAQAEALLTANPGMTENEALSRIMQGTSIEEQVIDSNDSWLNPMDWFTGPETERRVVTPEIGGPAAPEVPAAPAAPAGVGQPEAAVMLEEARAAIAKGADRVAVMMRLREMGIDPAGL